MTGPASQNFRHAVFIALILLAVFFPALDNPFLVDDYIFLQQDILERSYSLPEIVTEFESQHFMPLDKWVNITMFRAFPDRPGVLRALNLVFYILNALMIYIFLMRLTGSSGMSLFTTLLFTLHPLNSEIFSFVRHSHIILMSFFFFVSLTLYLFAREGKHPWLCWPGSLTSFFASLLFGEIGILLPAYVFLMEKVYYQTDWRRSLKKSLPFAAVAVFYFCLWLAFASRQAGLLSKMRSLDVNVIEYIATMAVMLRWYARNFFEPTGVVHIYNHPVIREYALLIFCLAAAVVAILTVLLRKLKWDSLKRLSGLWFLTGFCLVVPGSFVHAYMGLTFEPYWLYFSSLGLFLLTAGLIDDLRRTAAGKFTFVVVCGIVVFLAVVNQKYHTVSQSREDYARHWLDVTPENHIALRNMIDILLENNDAKPAARYAERATAITPYRAHNIHKDIGWGFIHRRQFDRAARHFRQALDFNPDYAEAYNGMGVVYSKTKQWEKAVEAFEKAVDLDSRFSAPYINLSNYYLLNRRYDKAFPLLRSVLGLKMEPEERLKALCKFTVLSVKFNDSENVNNSLNAIRMYYNDARSRAMLAFVAIQLEELKFAEDVLKSALKEFPGHFRFYNLLGYIYVQEKEFEKAMEIWREGEEHNPDKTIFRDNMKALKRHPRRVRLNPQL